MLQKAAICYFSGMPYNPNLELGPGALIEVNPARAKVGRLEGHVWCSDRKDRAGV